ncbi:SDR family oxidoreductase [Terrimonas rubra]|uniref:SDR family oxidoreductase n=1 Tax=Terrimonas rubra TaxID=1035890 RepID=A0ABW6A3E9_9BACT
MPRGRVEGKVIIVTGGSGLIGTAIVDHLKQHNAIVINAEINAETDIDSGNIKCDITDEASINNLLELVLTKFGRIDGLVNNAYPRTSDWGAKFEDIPIESWKQNIDMQLNSTFVLCQKVLKQMQLQHTGSIVNIASIYGVVGNDFTIYEGYGGTSPAAYAAIKGGIINFSRYLASYYGKYNIRVNCVSPGGIKDKQHPSFIERYENKSPLKRMGEAHEIAPAVTFLLSEEASFITGHNLMVDGGWTAI